MTIAIGSPAPDFTLPTDGGGTITLSSLKGHDVILYFYPKDNTSGCTSEACSFQEALPDFSAAEAVIIGVSKDSPSRHDGFKAKHALTFTLASDTDGSVCDTYGVWVEKSMYGRKYFGIERTTVLIDHKGVIRQIWRRVKVKEHVQEVLAATHAL